MTWRSASGLVVIQSDFEIVKDFEPNIAQICSSGQIYAASPNDLWCLTSKSEIIQNIQKLAKDKQFDIAVQLAVSVKLI